MKPLSDNARALYDASRPIGETVGSSRFSAWMTFNKVSAPEMAARLGCTESSVRNWRRASHVPTIEVARRIELITGIPIVWWVLRPETQPDPIAEIEALSLDAEGPEVEPVPCPGPSDLSIYLDDVE